MKQQDAYHVRAIELRNGHKILLGNAGGTIAGIKEVDISHNEYEIVLMSGTTVYAIFATHEWIQLASIDNHEYIWLLPQNIEIGDDVISMSSPVTSIELQNDFYVFHFTFLGHAVKTRYINSDRVKVKVPVA
jgi:hypothetical protein